MLFPIRGSNDLIPDCSGNSLPQRRFFMLKSCGEIPFKIIVAVVPLDEALPFFEKIVNSLSTKQNRHRLLKEIVQPLGIYGSGGALGYLTLNRLTSSPLRR